MIYDCNWAKFILAIVGDLFEWKIAVPLSKVAYGVYLIHFIMQMTDQAKVKIPYQFIIYEMVSFFKNNSLIWTNKIISNFIN